VENIITERLNQEAVNTLGQNNLTFKVDDVKCEEQTVRIEQIIRITADYKEERTRPGTQFGQTYSEFKTWVNQYHNSANEHNDTPSQMRLNEILQERPFYFFDHISCSLLEIESSYSKRCSSCHGTGRVTERKYRTESYTDSSGKRAERQIQEAFEKECGSCKGHGGHVTECTIYIAAQRKNKYSCPDGTSMPWFSGYLAKVSKQLPDYCQLLEQVTWDKKTYKQDFIPQKGCRIFMYGDIQSTQCQTSVSNQEPKLITFIGSNQMVESLSGLFNTAVIQELELIDSKVETAAQLLFNAKFGDDIGQKCKKPLDSLEFRHLQTSSVTSDIAEQTRQCFLTYANGFKQGKANKVSIFSFFAKSLLWFAFFMALAVGLNLLLIFVGSRPPTFQTIGVEFLVQHFNFYFDSFRHIGFGVFFSSAIGGAIIGYFLMKMLSSPKTIGKWKFYRWWTVSTILIYLLVVQTLKPVVDDIWAGFSLSHWQLSVNFGCNVLLVSMLIVIMRSRRSIHLRLKAQLAKIKIPALNKYHGFKSLL